MIPRRAADHVLELAQGFPIVSITGPRRFVDTAAGCEIQPVLVHGGELEIELHGCRVTGWSRLDGLLVAMPPR